MTPGARRLPLAEAVALAVVVLLALAAAAPGLLAPGDPLTIAPSEAFRPPGGGHLLGTDESGRDVLTRIVHGAHESLAIGVLATAIGIGLATPLGLLAGLGPRWLDFVITRVLEVQFAFPGILLALLFIVVAGPGAVTATIAVGLSTAPGYARLIRGEVRRLRGSGHLEQALVLGRSRWRRLTRHLLPAVTGTLFVIVTLGLGQSIVWASALSYLGLGTVPPAAEWGAMLAAGRTYLSTAWWLTFFPGLAIVLAAAATTLLGRSLQRRVRES